MGVWDYHNIEDYADQSYWDQNDEPTQSDRIKENKMAQAWKPASKETLQHYIDTILDEAEEKLTDWERNFIENIMSQVSIYGQLTQKQEEILERIYAERTS